MRTARSIHIAIAFQRTRLLIRRSISLLPGTGLCSSGLMVLMYGVFAVNGSLRPRRFAWTSSSLSSSATRPGPPDCRT